MKHLLFAIALLLCTNLFTQEVPKESKIFVRVYNQYGKKIAKGKILKITDSTLVLKKGNTSIVVPSSEINYIKTKRANSHNVLIGASGGFAFSLFGLSQSNGSSLDTAGFIILTPIFATIGAGIGYLTTLFKKSEQYNFAGDLAKWKGFKEDMYAPQY